MDAGSLQNLKEPPMPTSRSLFRASLFFLLLLIAISCFGQKDTGSIVGTVTDPTGAVVANAGVQVTDVERGQTFRTSTNESGEFVASPLHIGHYTVTVEKSGFKKAVSEAVELNVQGRVAINISLQVGQLTEQVVVTGAAPLLETETSELGQVVDGSRVSTLPLNGRNFAQLALLSTGPPPANPAPGTKVAMASAPTVPARCKTTSCSMASTTTPICPTF